MQAGWPTALLAILIVIAVCFLFSFLAGCCVGILTPSDGFVTSSRDPAVTVYYWNSIWYYFYGGSLWPVLKGAFEVWMDYFFIPMGVGFKLGLMVGHHDTRQELKRAVIRPPHTKFSRAHASVLSKGNYAAFLKHVPPEKPIVCVAAYGDAWAAKVPQWLEQHTALLKKWHPIVLVRGNKEFTFGPDVTVVPIADNPAPRRVELANWFCDRCFLCVDMEVDLPRWFQELDPGFIPFLSGEPNTVISMPGNRLLQLDGLSARCLIFAPGRKACVAYGNGYAADELSVTLAYKCVTLSSEPNKAYSKAKLRIFQVMVSELARARYRSLTDDFLLETEHEVFLTSASSRVKLPGVRSALEIKFASWTDPAWYAAEKSPTAAGAACNLLELVAVLLTSDLSGRIASIFSALQSPLGWTLFRPRLPASVTIRVMMLTRLPPLGSLAKRLWRLFDNASLPRLELATSQLQRGLLLWSMAKRMCW